MNSKGKQSSSSSSGPKPDTEPDYPKGGKGQKGEGSGKGSRGKAAMYNPPPHVSEAIGRLTTIMEGLSASERGHVASRILYMYGPRGQVSGTKRIKKTPPPPKEKTPVNDLISQTDESQAFNTAKKHLKEAILAKGKTEETDKLHEELKVLQDAYIKKRNAIRDDHDSKDVTKSDPKAEGNSGRNSQETHNQETNQAKSKTSTEIATRVPPKAVKRGAEAALGLLPKGKSGKDRKGRRKADPDGSEPNEDGDDDENDMSDDDM